MTRYGLLSRELDQLKSKGCYEVFTQDQQSRLIKDCKWSASTDDCLSILIDIKHCLRCITMSFIKQHLLEQQQLTNDVMTCLNDNDRDVIEFLSTRYLTSLDVDDVGMTDEVLDLMAKLNLNEEVN